MKKSVMIGIELTLFCMIVGTLVSYAAGSNPPSNGVRYGSTTVQSALDDLYNKISSGSTSCLPTRSPDTSTIAVGGSRTYSSGTYANSFTVSCANKTCSTCPSCESQGYSKIKTGTFTTVTGTNAYKTIEVGFKPKYLFINYVTPTFSGNTYLQNDLENAIMYSADMSTESYFRKNGWVKISSKNVGDMYALKITNTGFTLGHSQNARDLYYVAVG